MKHYGGVDPGWTGGFGVISEDGTIADVYEMPTRTTGKTVEYTTLDLDGIHSVMLALQQYTELTLGLENPTVRPDEPAQRSFRFGRQIGTLEAALHICGLSFFHIAPNLWKGRLDLPGKTIDPRSKIAAKFWERTYPAHAHLIYGPRGGVLDGRLDALLIAHFMRHRDILTRQRDVVRVAGRGSEAHKQVLFSGFKKKQPKFHGEPS